MDWLQVATKLNYNEPDISKPPVNSAQVTQALINSVSKGENHRWQIRNKAGK